MEGRRQQRGANEFAALSWCVSIGVNTFGPGFGPLTYPARDSAELCRALTDPDGCSLPSEQVIDVGAGTGRILKERVLARLCDVLPKVPNDGVLFLYYAGHGLVADSQFYLCASNTERANLKETAISSEELDTVLRTCPARGVLLILDCCDGGGFAEHAPRFFRELGKADFRILLSASKAGESSLEFKERDGTLFSNALILACAGGQIPGRSPGLIYFSELLSQIHFQVREDLESLGQPLACQTPVFAGVFPMDPLLFVHKRITLGAIKVRTARYSAQYVKGVITRFVFLLLAVGILLLGGFYTILDKSRYFAERNGHVALFAGLLRYNALGFPHLLWESDIPMSGLDAPTGAPGQLVCPLEAPPIPFLLNHLKVPFKAICLMRNHESGKAHSELRDFVQNPAAREGPWGEAACSFFAELATTNDSTLLQSFTTSPHNGVRLSGFKGLMRVDNSTGYQLVAKRNAYGDRALIREATPYIACGDEADAKHYINAVFTQHEVTADFPELFGFAIRCGVEIDFDSLWAALTNGSQLTSRDVPNYVLFTGRGKDWLHYATSHFNPDDENQLERCLFLFGCLPLSPEVPDLRPYLAHKNQWIRMVAAFACVRQRQLSSSELESQFKDFNYCLIYFKDSPELTEDLAYEALKRLNFDHLNIGDTRTMLDAIYPVASPRMIPYLQSILSYDDPNDIPSDVHYPAIRLLRKLGTPPDEARPYLNNDSVDITKEAFRWIADTRKAEAIDLLFRRFDEDSATYVKELLVDFKISSEPLKEVRRFLNGRQSARENAVAILAALGDTGEVVDLLTGPELRLRSIAADWVAANPHFQEIRTTLGSQERFPDFALDMLNRQAQLMSELKASASQVPPELQSWRLGLVTSWAELTPGQHVWITREFGAEP